MQNKAHKQLVGILGDLVAIPSVTGNKQPSHDIIDYIDNFLSKRKMSVQQFEYNGFRSVVALTRPTKKPKVMLMAHADVVPGDSEQFELHEHKGKLYGRGTFDMKFAIASFLQIVDDLDGNTTNYDFGIMITTDEEVGGSDGAARLVGKGYLPNVVVVPDSGDDWAIESYAKGAWHITITASGKGAHASRPWEGDNAIVRLMSVLTKIQKHFTNKKHTASTLNIGVINGGNVVNQVAATASASLDIRFGRASDDIKLRAIVEEICTSEGVELVTDMYTPPTAHDMSNEYIHLFAKCIEQVVNVAPSQTVSNGQTDARFFMNKGVPCVVVRPPGGGHHGPIEWIDKAAFIQFYQVLRMFLGTTSRIE